MMTVPGSVVFLVVLSAVAAETVREPGLEDCLKSDSLACVQHHIFRNLRALFGQEVQGGSVARKVRAAEVPMSSKDPGQRKELVNVKGADSTSNSTSDSSSEDKHEEASGVEGRGKKLKKMLPFLLLMKMKYFVYGVVAYIIIALIAKAALLKGSLALALAGVFLVKRLLTSPHVVARTEVKFHESSHTKTYGGGGGGGYAAAADYSAGAGSYGPSYSSAGYGGGAHSGGGWDSYNAPMDQNKQYVQSSGHSVVYRGQKPAGR